MNDSINSISTEQINEILEKYNIGKRPLSLALGWGDLTFTHYCDGSSTPNKKYDDILRRIYNEPEYYMLILERNKNNIANITYNKSKWAVKKMLKENFNNADYSNKMVDVISNEIISMLNEYELPISCVRSIVNKVNNAVENFVDSNESN